MPVNDNLRSRRKGLSGIQNVVRRNLKNPDRQIQIRAVYPFGMIEELDFELSWRSTYKFFS